MQLAQYKLYDDGDEWLGIRRGVGDVQAVAINPAWLMTYDSLVAEDVAVDSQSPGDKQPCAWRRRHSRRLRQRSPISRLDVFNK